MRVIAGSYRSRVLKAGEDRRVRPTSDKVKGALFNMLEPLEGTSVLDLYAGTGSLGIEALSRGASSVTFVEDHPASLALIRGNLEGLGVPVQGGPARVLGEDVLRACRELSRGSRTFDIVLADPPYGDGAFGRVLGILLENPVLSPGGILAVEHHERDSAILPGFSWPLVRRKRYGDTVLSLFKGAEKG